MNSSAYSRATWRAEAFHSPNRRNNSMDVLDTKACQDTYRLPSGYVKIAIENDL